MANTKLSSWVRQQILMEREDAGPCVKMILRHVSQTGDGTAKQNEVHTFDCRPIIAATDDKKDTFLDGLTDEIEAKAHDDAEAMGGHHRYVVYAYYKGQNKPLGRCVFSVDAGSDEDDESNSLSGTEPATTKGLMAQMMRHNEAMMRSTVMVSQSLMNTMRAAMEQAQSHNEKLMADKMQTFDLIEQLQSRRQERELAARQAEFSEKIKEEAFQKMMLLAPSVANRIMGKKMLPEPTTPMEETLKGLAASFTQEQMEQLANSGLLKPEQLIAVLNLFQGVMTDAKETKQAEGEQTARPFNGSGHA